MELLYCILFICYASYAYNRKSVVFAMPMLKKEGLDASYAGLIASCQNTAFSISTFYVGILSDRLNPNLIFASGLLISGFATLVFSTSSSATAFCSLWFLNGLAQGCGWPACAKILAQRASPSEFGSLWSFLSASQNFALSLCPFISAFMIVNYGWRVSVFTAGLVTLSLLAFFLLSLLFVSSAPKVESPEKKSDDKKDEEVPVLTLFMDPYIMLLSISFMIVFGARSATVDWGQMYLIEERNQNQYVASAFSSSLETGGFVGRLAGGYLTDWIIKRNAARSKQGIPPKSEQRMSVAFIFMLINVISIHLFKFAISEESSSIWITSIGALMGVSFYGPIAILGIVSSECVSANLSGTSHAIVALFGNIGATLSGLPCSYIAKFYGWSTVFFMLEILTAATLLILVKCRKLTPKVEKQKED